MLGTIEDRRGRNQNSITTIQLGFQECHKVFSVKILLPSLLEKLRQVRLPVYIKVGGRNSSLVKCRLGLGLVAIWAGAERQHVCGTIGNGGTVRNRLATKGVEK